MKTLPTFNKKDFDEVEAFIEKVLIHPKAEESALLELVEFKDHHFRVLFDIDYFHRPEDDASPPSKSQWSSLKKKLKRHDNSVFVFKEVGISNEGECYLDFGFLKTTTP